MFAIVQSQAEKFASLEHQLKVRHSWNLSKWVTTGELAEVTKGKTHKWLIDSKKGIKAIECIKLNIDFVDK